MKHTTVAGWTGALLFAAAVGHAAPAHDICADLGTDLGVGISSYSAAGDWPEQAELTFGVNWRFLYLYVVPTNDAAADREWFLLHKAEIAASIGAVPVFTFYQLLQRGQQAGIPGDEPTVVQAALQDATLMRAYFDDFVFLLETVAASPTPPIVHVEPDSWGFMMWALGIEGNADATSVPVAVASSGHPDLTDLPNHAGGLGQALLRLRDLRAPSVRLGWHASNFRVGTRPEVVTSFYSEMGEWDVLFTEIPHLEPEQSTWWEPLDPDLVDTNLTWMRTVSQAARLPVLIWQAPIGTTDYHFFNDDLTLLDRFAQAGLGGVLFDLRGEGDPDSFRAVEGDGWSAVPPASSDAGGTAADMRVRLSAYADAPLKWPEGSPCAGENAVATVAGSAGSSGATDDGEPTDDVGVTDGGGDAGSAPTTGSGGASSSSGRSGAGGEASGSAGDDGCGCRAVGSSCRSTFALLEALVVLGLLARGRRNRRRDRPGGYPADRLS